jgi:hypothetical protein
VVAEPPDRERPRRRYDYPIAPPRPPQEHEDVALDAGRLAIRIMERVMDRVGVELDDHYFDIFNIFSDVLQDELKTYSFDYVYELYSRDPTAVSRRFRDLPEGFEPEDEEEADDE